MANVVVGGGTDRQNASVIVLPQLLVDDRLLGKRGSKSFG
jgi:hypothetical protein